MRHDYTMTGYGVALRPVRESDAAFIVALRTQPELAAYIGETGDLASQQAWLDRYFQREGDYYFVIVREEDRAPVGTIALYDVQEQRRAQWGRWVAQPGGRFGVRGLALICRLGFDILGFETLYSCTVAENGRLVAFHDNCGWPQTGCLTNAVTIRQRSHDLVVHELDRRRWPIVRERLEQRIAGESKGESQVRRQLSRNNTKCRQV